MIQNPTFVWLDALFLSVINPQRSPNLIPLSMLLGDLLKHVLFGSPVRRDPES
jgi:hypothetical protein